MVALLLPGCPVGRWTGADAGGVVPALIDRSGLPDECPGSPVELALSLA